MTGELTYRRVHRAPRDLIFECLTTPEHLTRFWGPTGTSTPLDGITVELRPGGRFATVMVSDADGSRYEMRATYLEVAPPERLSWRDDASGMTTTATFVDLGDAGTEVVIHQVDVPEPMLAPEAQAGFASSLDEFDAYVTARAQAR